MPVGVMLPAAGPILAGAKEYPNVVRMTAGRFQTLEEADQLIRQDVADMVAIVRGMIADPDLMKKTLSGRADEIRPCLGCNQGCVGGTVVGGVIGCVVNPTVGSEATLHEGLIGISEAPKKVVVVGGGPAGMEAARVALLAGHKVVLFEAQSRLGGAVNIARRAPQLAAIGDVTLWQEREIFRLGADVRLSTFAEKEEIEAEAPDVVIVATGSFPREDGWQSNLPHLALPGTDCGHVHTPHTIFDVPVDQLDSCAVTYDDVGQFDSVAFAEYLVANGLAVTFVTRHAQMAPTGWRTIRIEPALRRLEKGSFRLVVNANLARIEPGSAEILQIGGVTTERVAADTVVMISGNVAFDDVYTLLTQSAPTAASPYKVKRIGDACSPRDLQAAIAEGHMTARALA